eukprot:gnl/MRDRNA2_/MRDRNA2_140431_c0_seq1.p1 gnl/MRDRNA2_/MRDRNA2_140431_c0~~gnl/MRDRNA2_/MRDRNA2_140431_c0_seq1.p1  ORF type:complete len:226 (-),score=39.98 gnl/MRDRNA2_/MRDRNA2_140431_c0_seq1:53-730(-)
MQAALLHEAAPYTPYSKNHSGRTLMLTSLLLGFGVGMLLLSPMNFERNFATQHPAMDMPVLPERAASSIGTHAGSPGAFTRPAPGWLRGFANPQRQPVSAFKPVTAMANGLGHGHSSSQLVRASEKPDVFSRSQMQQFHSAIEFAEECVGECLKEWSERAQTVPYKAESGQLSKEDVDLMKVTLEKIVAARMELETGRVNEQMLKDTAEEMKEVSKKISTLSLLH